MPVLAANAETIKMSHAEQAALFARTLAAIGGIAGGAEVDCSAYISSDGRELHGGNEICLSTVDSETGVQSNVLLSGRRNNKTATTACELLITEPEYGDTGLPVTTREWLQSDGDGIVAKLVSAVVEDEPLFSRSRPSTLADVDEMINAVGRHGSKLPEQTDDFVLGEIDADDLLRTRARWAVDVAGRLLVSAAGLLMTKLQPETRLSVKTELDVRSSGRIFANRNCRPQLISIDVVLPSAKEVARFCFGLDNTLMPNDAIDPPGESAYVTASLRRVSRRQGHGVATTLTLGQQANQAWYSQSSQTNSGPAVEVASGPASADDIVGWATQAVELATTAQAA